ncbi:MAG: hypothetical protein M1814_003398 [Vezdaea aestivalis]|nr:MAG: hypothetical protein M1814_003398 [Vezdaea aestivalis]
MPETNTTFGEPMSGFQACHGAGNDDYQLFYSDPSANGNATVSENCQQVTLKLHRSRPFRGEDRPTRGTTSGGELYAPGANFNYKLYAPGADHKLYARIYTYAYVGCLIDGKFSLMSVTYRHD